MSGPGTPCGEYLRRFWHGIVLSKEVGELPLAIRLFGEDLVLFRDGGGQVGLLHRHCAHRGRVARIRAHRRAGHPLLLPRVAMGRGRHAPRSPRRAGRQPTLLEGPPGRLPGLRVQGHRLCLSRAGRRGAGVSRLRHVRDPGHRHGALHLLLSCNWLQVTENGIDPVHSMFLHTLVNGPQFADTWGSWATWSTTKARSRCIAPSHGEWNRTSGPGCRRTSCPTSPNPVRSTASTVAPAAISAQHFFPLVRPGGRHQYQGRRVGELRRSHRPDAVEYPG